MTKPWFLLIWSLFTAIPVDKTCVYIRKKLEDDSSLHSRNNLDIEDIISLLNFVLSNNFFVYNDTIYKQIHGCAMGSRQPCSSQPMHGRNRKNSNQRDYCLAEILEAVCRRQFLRAITENVWSASSANLTYGKIS